MLELRPICEHCATALPPESTEARICSFECTFCRTCVEEILDNVCPNCGGGFVPRPVRPRRNWNDDNYLGRYPAGMKIQHRPIDPEKHRQLVQQLRTVSPQDR
jgi:uncharacterized protein